MLKRMNLVLSLVMAFALMGCAGNSIKNTDFDSENVKKNDKGIVVTRTIFDTKSWLWGKMELHVDSIWKNVDKKDEDQPLRYNFSKTGWFSGGSTNMALHMVEPGTYYLESMGMRQGREILSISRKNVKKYLRKRSGVFTVAPGEVIYIGDLRLLKGKCKTKFNGNGTCKMSMEVVDNYDEAIKAVKEQQPSLSDKLQKRLIHF